MFFRPKIYVLLKGWCNCEFSSMENATISLKEALEIFGHRDKLGNPVPFDISAYTFSRVKRTGGELKEYKNVTYLPSSSGEKQILDTLENILDPIKVARDPNHNDNYTRNLQLNDGLGGIKKINILFIKTINNKTVIY